MEHGIHRGNVPERLHVDVPYAGVRARALIGFELVPRNGTERRNELSISGPNLDTEISGSHVARPVTGNASLSIIADCAAR